MKIITKFLICLLVILQTSFATLYAEHDTSYYITQAETLLAGGTAEDLDNASELLYEALYDSDCSGCATNADILFLHAYVGSLKLVRLNDLNGNAGYLDLMLVPYGHDYIDAYHTYDGDESVYYPDHILETFTSIPALATWIIPTTIYDLEAVRTYVEDFAIGEIDLLLADYDALITNNDLENRYDDPPEVRLSAAVTGLEDDRAFDNDDFILFRGMLHFAKGVLLTQMAYHFNVDPDDPLTDDIFDEDGWPTMQTSILNKYPEYLSLAPTESNTNNGAALMAQARESFRMFIEDFGVIYSWYDQPAPAQDKFWEWGLSYFDESEERWYNLFDLAGALPTIETLSISTNLNPVFGGTATYPEPISLRALLDMSNDLCTDAYPLTVDVSTNGTTINMTGIDITTLNEFDTDNDTIDVWYSFTTDTSGVYQIHLQGFVDAGATVAIFDDCDTTQMLSLGYYAQDDGEISPYSDQLFNFMAGESYLLRVAGLADYESDFAIRLSYVGAPLVNDRCEDAIPLTPDETIYGSNVNATGIEFSSCGYQGNPHGVWYSFTPQVDSEYSITTTEDQTLDSTVTIFADCADTTVYDLYLTCEDDNMPADNIIQENITMEMAEGLTYLIRVAGYQGKEGDFTLNITPTAGRILVTGFTGNGAISPDGASMQPAEETVTITATPQEDWIVSHWTIDGVTIPSNALSQTVAMDTHKMVVVHFELNLAILTINEIIGNGAVSPDRGSYTYDKNQVVTVTATPDEGWQVVAWTINGTENPSHALSQTITMDSDKTVQVVFEEIMNTLTIAPVVGNGTITPDVGTDTYLWHEIVTITATPDVGWRLRSWTINGIETAATESTLSLDMNIDHTVLATFALITFDLTVDDITGNGAIDPGVGLHAYVPDTQVTLTATPDAGWRIYAWTIDGAEIISDAPSMTITMDGDTTVAMSFKVISVILQFSQVIAGGVPDVLLASSESNLTMSDIEHLSAHPIPRGYRISHWIGTENNDSRSTNNTVFMDRSKAVFVVFAKSLKPAATKVVAGKHRGADFLKLTGSFDATLSEIVLENSINIDVWSDNGFSFSTNNPIPLNTAKDIKKNVFTYRAKLKKNDGAKVTHFTFGLKKLMSDLKQKKFSLTIKNLDLTGLSSPLFTRITIGNYIGLAEANEDSINDIGVLPQIFMRAFADTLVVKNAKVKNGRVDGVTITGTITAIDNSVLLSEEDVTIAWSGQTFIIPAGTFKEPKKGQKYIVKNLTVTNGNKITTIIDLLKCTFRITIKNGAFDTQQITNQFGIKFGNYDKSVDLDMRIKSNKLSVYSK